MNIRDRIKELRRVKAGELRPNPKNWRKHPQAQQDALRGVLAEVGYVDALLAREKQDGALELLDGHLRAETTPDTEVPVLIVDLSDEEADKVLATFDPLSAMAEADSAALDSLLREVSTSSEAVAKMLADLAKDAGCEWAKQTVVEDEVPEPPVDPVTKPGDLWLLGEHRLLFRNHGGNDDDVYDPFLGSGTTIIAAEQLNRRCYGLEIEPRYCDVICQRWEKLTGKKAVLDERPAAGIVQRVERPGIRGAGKGRANGTSKHSGRARSGAK